MKGLAIRSRLLLLVVCLFAVGVGLVATGCGSDGDSNGDNSKSAFAKLVIKHNLSYDARALEDNVVKLVVRGFKEDGTPSFAPESYTRTALITQSIPVTTKSLRLEYYDNDGDLLGIFVQAVELRTRKDVVIEDPAWQDAGSQTFVRTVDVATTYDTVVVDNYVRCTAMANMYDGSAFCVQDVTEQADWAQDNRTKIVLISAGSGTFQGFAIGEARARATYLGVSNVSPIIKCVEDDDVTVSLTPYNMVAPAKGNPYVLPVSFAEAKDPDDIDYAGPIFGIAVSDGVEEPELSVVSSDPEVATAVIEKTESLGTYLRIIPDRTGTVTFTVSYVKKFFDGSEQVYVKSVDCTFFDGKLAKFRKYYDKFPDSYKCAAGVKAPIAIYGIFTDADGVIESTPINMMDLMDLSYTPEEQSCVSPAVDYTESGLVGRFQFATKQGSASVTVSVPEIFSGLLIYGDGGKDEGSVSATCKVTVTDPVMRGFYIFVKEGGQYFITDKVDLSISAGKPLELVTGFYNSDGSMSITYCYLLNWDWVNKDFIAEEVDAAGVVKTVRAATTEPGQVLVKVSYGKDYVPAQLLINIVE